MTTNRPFDQWGQTFCDDTIAAAIRDRLLHHSHVLSIRGESYRLREKKRAGLFGVPPAPREAMAGSHSEH